MSPVSQFPKLPPPEADEFSNLEAASIASIVFHAFRTLPPADQQVVLDRLIKMVRMIPATRAGDTLGTVIRILPRRKEWTAEQIRSEVAAAGIEASVRDVFNAIGYLARKGHVTRLGGGRYLVNGVAVQTSDNLGGEPRIGED